MRNIYLFFFLLLILGACSVYNYKSTYHPPSILFGETELSVNSDAWDFYLHDGYGRSHKVDSISIDSSSISTVLETPVPIELPEKLSPSEYARNKEVHVFVKILNLNTNTPVEFQASDIENVVMYSSPEREAEKQDSAQSAGKTILIVLGVVLGSIAAGILLIFLALQALFNGSGCYIATMAYGSYEASEVLVLRRFRDEKLKQSFLGRVFIANYYAFSPLLVKFVQKTGFAERLIRRKLDGFVNRLRTKYNW